MPLTERPQTRVLTHVEVQRKLNRIAREIHEEHHQEKEVVLVGVASRGSDLAKRLAKSLTDIKAFKVTLGEIQLNKEEPLAGQPKLSLSTLELEGKTVLLVDDVLQSGRTLMHAAAHLVSFQLKRLTTVVLVDRLHRSFPIRADIVGITLSTTVQEHISVKLGKKDEVYLD